MIPFTTQVDKVMGQHSVVGTYGKLFVDSATGNVVEWRHEPGCGDEYSSIVRFDVDEYVAYYGAMDDTDILLIGFWNEDGSYEPPVIEERERRTNAVATNC
jgi:hypothetical protein